MAWLALAVVSAPAAAPAHVISTGLASITVGGATVRYQVTFVIAELPAEVARPLAAAVDGDHQSAALAAGWLREKVLVRSEQGLCRPGRVRLQGSRLGDMRATLELELQCPAPPWRLVIRDDWSGVLGAHHRTLARIEGPGGIREAVFTPETPETTIDLERPAPGWPGFVVLGFEHILTGYDHLLFLAALLLGGGGIVALLKVVTAFTLAHSVTLAVAVLGLATVPGRVVEPLIAASIICVAGENLWSRQVPRGRWLVSFAFGLIHGFGFASALTPLDLPARNLALALLGFNLGVEAGQAAVIAIAVPALLLARGRSWQPRLVRTLSGLLVGVGVIWFVQRLLIAPP